jgi:hypothetical protein
MYFIRNNFMASLESYFVLFLMKKRSGERLKKIWI